jgi:membrane-bound ClpP family serine protease
MLLFDTTIREALNERLSALEKHFDADVVFYYGEIHPGLAKSFRDFIEKLKEESANNRLVVFLNTPGGNAETVEKMVEIMRFHYAEVFFVVPDFAMSAGTILCMAGDRIFMDYSSSLGPIDPQVWNGKEFVPALGYLDKVEQLLAKAKDGTITQAEFLILQSLDLAMLSRYEQPRDLTVTLLKKWLVQYKFKDWSTHGTDPKKVGQTVTPADKQARAEEIAKLLGDNKTWHSHGRMISAVTLQSVVRLKIDDYSADTTLRALVRAYNDLLVEYIARSNMKLFMHSRNYF